MKHLLSVVAAVILSAGVSVGITHSVMQEHTHQVAAESFQDGTCKTRTFEDGSVVMEDGNGRLCSEDYAQQVVSRTKNYGPCVKAQETTAGRIMYRDAVADNTDDGKRRSLRAQVDYVKATCRNAV
ncbi:hypothetical protein OIE82_27045 [Streptomyces althioticus]|uniref:Uncharacterized protein n=1 Tax=Streptomyces althioticus TaxID=83380 RepID=A0ABZ1YD49_9ACTN